MADDHDEAHKALEERLTKALHDAVTDRALAAPVIGTFRELEGRVAALERRLADLGNTEADVPPSINPEL